MKIAIKWIIVGLSTSVLCLLNFILFYDVIHKGYPGLSELLSTWAGEGILSIIMLSMATKGLIIIIPAITIFIVGFILEKIMLRLKK